MIFAKYDAHAPIISQLMQVNLDDPDELLRFWNRCIGLAQVSYSMEWLNATGTTDDINTAIQTIENDKEFFGKANLLFISGSETLTKEAHEAGFETVKEHKLSQFRRACELARYIVSMLHEINLVSGLALSELKDLGRSPSDQYDFQPSMRFANTSGEIGGIATAVSRQTAPAIVQKEQELGDVLLARNEFLPPYKEATINAIVYIRQEIDALVILWRKGYKTAHLATCADCGNVYMATRKGQTYCSIKHGNKIAQRRAEERKKKSHGSIDKFAMR